MVRTRGSTAPYSRSTIRLTNEKQIVIRMMQPMTMGVSRPSTDWIISRPTPGQANTVYVSTEPPSIWPISRPMTVMVGSMPLRKACRMMMVFRDRPLA